ncbi:MAG: hypothetical protein K0U72_04575 [Gammaproteobacteria bacterium]|nr:hypothetical protein [Gammaproteobacteria bacterium]
MSNRIINLVTAVLRRRAAWLAIVPVALLQLTIAVHQFDHVADSIDSSCHICVQLDRVDGAVDHPAEIASVPSIGFLKSGAPAVTVALAPVRHFDTRAPPQI